MPNYMLAYCDAREPDTPEEASEQKARWGQWVADLGDAAVNPGTPLMSATTVTADGVKPGGGPNPLTGFSVVSAASLDEAIEIARSCPFVEVGNIVVAEMMEMPG